MIITNSHIKEQVSNHKFMWYSVNPVTLELDDIRNSSEFFVDMDVEYIIVYEDPDIFIIKESIDATPTVFASKRLKKLPKTIAKYINS